MAKLPVITNAEPLWINSGGIMLPAWSEDPCACCEVVVPGDDNCDRWPTDCGGTITGGVFTLSGFTDQGTVSGECDCSDNGTDYTIVDTISNLNGSYLLDTSLSWYECTPFGIGSVDYNDNCVVCNSYSRLLRHQTSSACSGDTAGQVIESYTYLYYVVPGVLCTADKLRIVSLTLRAITCSLNTTTMAGTATKADLTIYALEDISNLIRPCSNEVMTAPMSQATFDIDNYAGSCTKFVFDDQEMGRTCTLKYLF